MEKIDEKSTKVTYMSNADIKGSIPAMIKNQLAKKQGEVAAMIEEIMKAGKKWLSDDLFYFSTNLTQHLVQHRILPIN